MVIHLVVALQPSTYRPYVYNAHARYHVTVRSGCKIITYLESQTHSFLLTVQLSSGYDDG